MSELTTRASALAAKVFTYHMDDVNDLCEMDADRLREWFEQALLAERRLALEQAAKIAEDTLTEFDAPLCVSKRAGDRTRLIAGRLRAAAEKEVGK